MTHTPTPWKLSETFDHRPAIMDADGHNIVSWDPATIHLFGDPRPDIITACNTHQELVAALKGMIDLMDNKPTSYEEDQQISTYRAILEKVAP